MISVGSAFDILQNFEDVFIFDDFIEVFEYGGFHNFWVFGVGCQMAYGIYTGLEKSPKQKQGLCSFDKIAAGIYFFAKAAFRYSWMKFST